MENEDKPLGFLLNYIKPTFEDSLFSKVLDKVGGKSQWTIS